MDPLYFNRAGVTPGAKQMTRDAARPKLEMRTERRAAEQWQIMPFSMLYRTHAIAKTGHNSLPASLFAHELVPF